MSASIQLAQISLFVFGWFWFKINFREKIWKGLFYLQWKEQQARSKFHLYIIRNAFSQTHRRMGEWLVVHNFEPVIQPVSFTAFFSWHINMFICKLFLGHHHHLCGIYKDRHHRCNNIGSIPCCGTLHMAVLNTLAKNCFCAICYIFGLWFFQLWLNSLKSFFFIFSPYIFWHFIQVNGEVEKLLKEFAIPKRGR